METQAREAAAIMECSGMAGQKDELHRFRWRSDSIYDKIEEEIGTIQRRTLYDTHFICLPRHSSFTINHTFAKWGNTGQNMAESIGNTTVSTTKAYAKK